LDLHIGSVSSDLGAGTYGGFGCEDVTGDEGVLGVMNGVDQAERCLGSDHRYLISISPKECQVFKDASGDCTQDSCTQQHCNVSAGTSEELVLIYDSKGCPRCVNYDPESLFMGDVSAMTECMGFLPESCVFSQPLEAMHRALDNNPANFGFLRENAYLAVFFMVIHDDCSARDPNYLFDPSQDSLSEPLGYFSAFRCFEFGVTCDINNRTHVGLRHDCRPREDDMALLFPISSYIEFIHSIKDTQLITISLMSAPMNNQTVMVGRDQENRPEVQQECGHPAIRLKYFADAMNSDDSMNWAYYENPYCPPCSDFYQWNVGRQITDRILQASCFPQPLHGCADVGATHGEPQAPQTCAINNQCLPACEVVDVSWRGTQQERRRAIPHCLEIGLDGTVLTGNTDRSLAYADGRPAERDPELPVAACWFVGYDPNCEHSNRAALVVSRKNDPPPRTFAEVSCRGIEATETQCADGVDNDQDCLIDSDDPDC